jgi:hypothetical protein
LLEALSYSHPQYSKASADLYVAGVVLTCMSAVLCSVSELIGDLPLRPAILGTLVPQQINLWLGNSVEGSTTGLHHDFHDNTYILLKGRKRYASPCVGMSDTS